MGGAESFIYGIPWDKFDAPAILSVIAVLVITDKIVWHKRLEKAERDRDRWEGIALRGLGVAENVTVQTELTNELLSNLPDPASKESSST